MASLSPCARQGDDGKAQGLAAWEGLPGATAVFPTREPFLTFPMTCGKWGGEVSRVAPGGRRGSNRAQTSVQPKTLSGGQGRLGIAWGRGREHSDW